MRRAWADGCRGGLAAAVVLTALGWPAVGRASELTADERAAVQQAIAALPSALRGPGPTPITRDAPRCDAEGWPDDDALIDDAGGIHLCASSTAPEGVAHQVVTALALAFDRSHRWSDAPAWRRINGWQTRLTAGLAARAENVGPAGFATPRGRRSPAWDLATFIAASTLDAATGMDCRLLAQATFVRGRLGLPGPSCANFEAWADLAHLTDIEVVLAAPSTAMVGSLFGHLFLRLVYRDDAGATPVHLSRTVGFLADNEVPFAADPGYALKGIAGFYTASLHERPFLDSYREYVVVEGRDLRRWRVTLSSAQRRAVLEQLWTGLEGARYPYYFFRQNCATLLLDLMEGVLSADQLIGRPGLLAAPPASTLERWASAPDVNGQPRITFVPEAILSFDHEARLASQHRAALESRLGAGLSPVERRALSVALVDAHAAAPPVRADAYRRLGRLLATTRGGDVDDVHAWLRDSATIESHLSVVANLQEEARADVERRRQVELTAAGAAARLRPLPQLAAAIEALEASDPDARLGGYQRLRAFAHDDTQPREVVARVRLYALLRSESRYDVARMKRIPQLREELLFVDADKPIAEQPYLSGHEELLRLPLETRVSPPLAALQQAKQTLFAARALDSVGTATDGESMLTARAGYEGSVPRSGIDQFALLAAAWTDAGAIRGGLVVAGALYDEELGGHHRFGFPSDTGFVVGRSAVAFTLEDGRSFPSWAAYQARAFGYRSLRLPLPEASGQRWPLGWELHADLAGSRARALTNEVNIGWGVLAPLAAREELRDHALVAAGIAYRGFFPGAGAATPGHPQGVAASLALELRAGVGRAPRYRSWLAARLWAEPMALLVDTTKRFGFETGALFEAHLALRGQPGNAHDPAVLLRGQMVRTTVSFTGPGPATEALLSAGIELR